MTAKESRRLQVSEDLRFQHRDWIVQRIGWTALALILLAGLAGLLGPGPLSNAEVGNNGSLKVQYERFVRHGSKTELRVYAAPSAFDAGEARLAISRDYLSSFDLEQVTPSPVRVDASGDALIFVFQGQPSAVTELSFELQPDELGTHPASVALNGQSVSIQQFTYP
jgi:hypothetical protein